jgi:hypothetical protein
MKVSIPCSVGELLDKITILQLKEKKIHEELKLSFIRKELNLLEDEWRKLLKSETVMKEGSKQLERINSYRKELYAVNERLWGIEDALRVKEDEEDFGGEFIELARSVYINNDQRAELKLAINNILGSDIVEIKSYNQRT